MVLQQQDRLTAGRDLQTAGRDAEGEELGTADLQGLTPEAAAHPIRGM
jgi:hypothetical protein